jgi:hypothetical protein
MDNSFTETSLTNVADLAKRSFKYFSASGTAGTGSGGADGGAFATAGSGASSFDEDSGGCIMPFMAPGNIIISIIYGLLLATTLVAMSLWHSLDPT